MAFVAEAPFDVAGEAFLQGIVRFAENDNVEQRTGGGGMKQHDQRWFGTHCEIISATIALKVFLSCPTDSLLRAPE